MKITIKTPPISVNQLYTGRRFLTKEGRETKEAMAREAFVQHRGEPRKDKISVIIFFYFKDNRKDIDGCLKALFDSMEGILWDNDRQIVSMKVYKLFDKQNPRTEIEIL